jgi:hypothetical protein
VTTERGVEHPARLGAIGAAITAFAFLDARTVGLLIAALDAWLPAVIVFAVAPVVLTLINPACCRWVERQWDAWIACTAKRMEATLPSGARADSRAIRWHGSRTAQTHGSRWRRP